MKDIQELKELLLKYVDQSEDDRTDDFNPADTFGGNFDDAYWGGFEAGEKSGKTALAEKILKEFFGT